MKKFLFLLCSLLFSVVGAWATTPTTLRSTVQVTSADQFADGKLYAVRVNGGSFITESDGQYVAPNAQNAITDEALYYIAPNADGETFTVKNIATGNFWGELTGSAVGTFAPSADPVDWTLTFSGSNVVAGSGGFYINRSSGVMHGWSSGISLQFYEVNNVTVEVVDALDDLSNNKCYVVYNQRAAWNVADGATGANAIAMDTEALSERFALINYKGQYHIYSLNAKAYLTSANTLGDPEAVTILDSGVEGYPFFFKFDDSHNINVSGGRVVIDSWTEVDAGNANAIIEVADFDPTEALAMFPVELGELQNASFDLNPTYAADATGNLATAGSAQSQNVEGWNLASSAAWSASASFALGTAATLNNAAVPATAAEGSESTAALGVTVGWGGTVLYTQTIDLPAGTYVLSYKAYNAAASATQFDCKVGVVAGDQSFLSTKKSFAVGAWEAEAITFTLDEDVRGVTIQVGGTAVSGGSTSNAIVFFDDIVLSTDVTRTELQALLATANATVEAKDNVGENLFQNPVEAYDTFVAAVAAAQAVADNADATTEELEAALEALETAVETYAAALNAPEADALYTFQQKASGLYMALDADADKVVLSEEAQTFTWTTIDGNYYLTNEAGYVGQKSNNWTTSVLEANKIVVTATPVEIDGATYYTLNEPFGIIATDGTNAGDACYLDKSTSMGDKAYWTIAVAHNESEAYQALEAEIATAEALLAAAENENGKEEFAAAIETAKAELGKTDEEMTEALAALKVAEEAFNESQNTVEPETFEYAKYIVKNVGSGLYWGAGNDWGTRASLIVNPEFLKFDPTDMPEGQYKLESQVNNGGTQYYFNGDYMDNGTPVALTITKLANGNYTIAKAEDGTLYGYDGTSTVLGKGLTNADDPNAQWTIQTLDAAKAALANATVEAPMNATLLLDDPNFGRNNRYSNKWTFEASNQNINGDVTNYCAESYHAVFTLSQEVEAPNGVYSMTAQGFYRQDGEDNDNLPVFYANDETATFPLKTGSENSMANASVSFTNGLYTIDPIFVEVTDGKLNVGAKLEGNTALWCIFDNFQLTYFGPDATVDEARFAALISQVAELREKAEELKGNADASEVAKTGLQTALDATADVAAEAEALDAAIATLSAAIEVAEAGIDIAPKLAAAKRLVASTNVYTAEALETYQGIIDAAETKYTDGTLTKAEAAAFVNPEVVAAWRSANDFDDLLLSAWTINDVQAKDFETALYINTWSVEGETDGSEFKVPFFEYWTGDANSLGETKLTATMTGLEPGLQEVSAWIRVRAKNGFTAPVTGITLDVNGENAVDVAAGTQVGDSQFYLAEFKTVGTVGEDGILKININVAADNNISWLSFKNVKFAAKDEAEYAYEQAMATLKDGYTYRIFVEENGTKYYLKADGYLTASEDEAKIFTFNAVTSSGKMYPTGWNLGCRFTNPSLTNGSTGDVVNDGHIHVGGNDRDDWERQVFFLKDGKYAVRATNANSENWGANTYWDAFEGADLPEAGYSLEPNYIWQVESYVDLSALNDIVEKLEAIIAASDTYEAAEGVAESASMMLDEIKGGEYETLDEVNEAVDQVRLIGQLFIANIKAVKDIDITDFYLVNATPTSNYNGWEGDKSNAFDAGNNVAEFWNMSGASFHQTVTLPEGAYRLIVTALTRTDMVGTVYAGENSTEIATVDRDIVNSRAQANTWFNAGNGINVVDFEMAEAGDIEIGLKADNTTSDYWTVWRDFRIILTGEPASTDVEVTYYGNAVTFDEDGNALVDDVYDESKLAIAGEDENATIETSYAENDGVNTLTITVKGADTDTNPNNVATYTIVFSKAVGIKGLNADDENAVIYDLAGRRVSKAVKGGVYIINGRKVAIK